MAYQSSSLGMNDRDIQKKYFVYLQKKYKVPENHSAYSDRFLYLILRKAELKIPITNIELQWLEENLLFNTADIIHLQQYQAEDRKKLESEFLEVRSKYCVPKDLEIPLSSPIYAILEKIETGHDPTDSDLEQLNRYHLVDTTKLIRDILEFSRLKAQYKITSNSSQTPEEPLFSILKKLNERQELLDSEATWLLDSNFSDILEIYWQQEEERKAELEFLELKSKYQVESHPDISISSPLYSILKKLDTEEELNTSEGEFLEKQNLKNLVKIKENQELQRWFSTLKKYYKAEQYQTLEISSPLFELLKRIAINDPKNKKLRVFNQINRSEYPIREQDIQWLREEELVETANIAQKIHFTCLKTKYQIVGQLASDPFYEIMLKLEREERLDPKQVIQLIEEGRLSRNGKISLAHYKLEARFYEKEYRRTGNRWNLPSASSNWRKANEPEKALKVTEHVNWTKVREADLKSAIWVTRGAAFRDLARLDESETRLDESENCAMQAMECQPENHQPYTLMGAICYDRGEYESGDRWFSMAAERGADNTDDEIERIVRMTKDKDKRREVAEYLLDKDPDGYGWAKSYLKS
ncbi:MAG: hypothetical protein SWY16_07920 [Cyanobacteriota bacterium]|nr:hypothetical protein [Cyanobacteriota bacterium]